MSNTRLVVAVALALVVTGVTVGASAPVAADGESSSTLSGVLSPDADESATEWVGDGFDATIAGAQGAGDRAGWWVANNVVPESVLSTLGVGGNDSVTATEQARATAEVWNRNSATLDRYGNERVNWTTNETVAITWHVDDATATRYLEATVSNGSVTTEMVANTSRNVTETVAVCGYAAEQSDDELAAFVDEYASAGKDVDAAFLAEMKGKYGSDVDTSLYPTSGECGGSD
jgi:hypothetical protein